MHWFNCTLIKMLWLVVLAMVSAHHGHARQIIGSTRSVDRFLWSLKEVSSSKDSSSSFITAASHFRSFSCNDRDNGVYPDLASRCSVYYRCLGGAVYSYVCGEDTLMDWQTQECLPPGNVSCPSEPPSSLKCMNQSDGFYPDYGDHCRSYYSCKNGSVNDWRSCPGNSMWDVLTGSCGQGRHVSCSPPTCWGLSDGDYPLPGSQCSVYFTCKDGIRTDQICPYPQIFDYMEKKCISGAGAVCYENACVGKANGYHALHEASCRSYYRCFTGAMIELNECPSGTIFDGETCVSTNKFTCWDYNAESCNNRPDGLYAAEDSTCTGFFLCRYHQLVRSFRCSPGYVFNGKECINDENHICTRGPKEPNCKNKVDGYYTVEKTGCNTFIFCRNGNKASEHSCPGNYVFNGEYCVDSLAFQCPSRLDLEESNMSKSVREKRSSNQALDDCSHKEDGYYTDLASGCKSYYFCLKYRKMFVQKCLDNESFNGKRCVKSSVFTCPVEVNSIDCTFMTDGIYHSSSTNNCSLFYKCFLGTKYSYSCPKNQVFNGKTCVPQSSYSCSSTATTVCLNMKNGYHANVSDGCTSYFLCSHGELLSSHFCNAGTVFNGERCVSDIEHTCLDTLQKDCPLGFEGYKQDLESGCRRYYYCKNGVKIWLSCPDNHVFNNTSCVRFTDYQCPT